MIALRPQIFQMRSFDIGDFLYICDREAAMNEHRIPDNRIPIF
jgi:hypothetical protein